MQRTNPKRLSFVSNGIEGNISSINTSLTPKKLVIEDLDINLPILPSKVKRGEWEVVDSGVSYLTSSPLPGQIGNSILYGHNWTNLLGKLVNVKPNQVIKIKYQDGSIKNFQVKYTAVVLPKDVAILKQTTDRRITLYTCTGFFDSKRFVAVAQLI